MKNLFYGVIVLGIIAVVAGGYMYAGMHFHGRALAVIGIGVLAVIAGIAAIVVARPKAAVK